MSTFRRAWEVVCEAAGIWGGTELLDLGCGDGAFCAFAAARGATVHGLDAEPDAIARALKAMPDVDFRLGLMESLPWPDASFDVVTSFNAVQYSLDPELALAEACRVARPSGGVAVCKWGAPADNEFFAFLTQIEAGGVRADRLPATDPVADAIRHLRLDVVATGEVPAPIELAGDAALAASLVRAGAAAGPGAGGERELVAAAAPYRRADGSYRFENRMCYWMVRWPR
jgi:SAM-dependent methyltransferase